MPYVPEIGVMSSLLLGSSFLLCVLHMLIMFILFSVLPYIPLVVTLHLFPTIDNETRHLYSETKSSLGVLHYSSSNFLPKKTTQFHCKSMFYWAHFPDSIVSLSQQENQFSLGVRNGKSFENYKTLLQDTLEDQEVQLCLLCLRIISLGVVMFFIACLWFPKDEKKDRKLKLLHFRKETPLLWNMHLLHSGTVQFSNFWLPLFSLQYSNFCFYDDLLSKTNFLKYYSIVIGHLLMCLGLSSLHANVGEM